MNKNEENQVKIVCFGDSNTWGCSAEFSPIDYKRYSPEIRWTGILSEKLHQINPKYSVIEEGLNGRTTDQDDPEEKNGKKYLDTLLKNHYPIELIIIMLGVNNLKEKFNQETPTIAASIKEMIQSIKKSNKGPKQESPKILLISPALINKKIPTSSPQLVSSFIGGRKKSKLFKEQYSKVAEEENVFFLAASDYIEASQKDCVHFEPETHKILANVIFEKCLNDIFQNML